MKIGSVPCSKGNFISRWLRKIIRDVLEDHDRGRFVTIYSNRNPDSRDVLYSPGCQWYNEETRQRFALKQINADWKPMEIDK